MARQIDAVYLEPTIGERRGCEVEDLFAHIEAVNHEHPPTRRPFRPIVNVRSRWIDRQNARFMFWLEH